MTIVPSRVEAAVDGKVMRGRRHVWNAVMHLLGTGRSGQLLSVAAIIGRSFAPEDAAELLGTTSAALLAGTPRGWHTASYVTSASLR